MRNLTYLAALAVVLTASGCREQVVKAQEHGRDIEVTVYNMDFAMVREVRPIDLKQGISRVGFPNVSKELDQQSVLFGWKGKDQPAEVLSSRFDLGIGNSERLLERFVGQKVELVRYDNDGQEAERISGVLQTAEPGNVVLLAEGKYLINPPGTIEAPSDSGIVTVPQLSAEFEAAKPVKTDVVVSYVTGGLSWSADYVATLDPKSDQMNLECWASVTNRTGSAFPQAKINFAVGAPNNYLLQANRKSYRVSGDDFSLNDKDAESRVLPSAKVAVTAPMTSGESYVYPSKSTATLSPDQINRVKMMSSLTVPIKRDYNLTLPYVYPGGYYDAEWDGKTRRNSVMAISFFNREKDGLGLPLPSGGIRVYEGESGDSTRYMGSSSVINTPKDAKVIASLAESMDVYGIAKLVKKQRVDRRTSRRLMQVELHNAKQVDVELRVVQQIYGVVKMTGETHKRSKSTPGYYEWTVKIPAGGKTTLGYTVDMR